jgi:type I restriction enzyme S subunit
MVANGAMERCDDWHWSLVVSLAEIIKADAPVRRFKPYPAYKDSGFEWLGQVPDPWEVKRLKFTAQIEAGQSPPSELVGDGPEGLPFLQGNAEFGAINPRPSQICDAAPKRADAGDILISVRAPVGALNIADQDYGIGRGLCAIKPASGFDVQFAFYSLYATRTQLDAVATGSTYDAVTASEIGNLPTLLPDLPEQRAIVAFLDHETARIDALVAKKERLIELLHEERTALTTRAVTKGLNPGVPTKNSAIRWLGNIPAHWEVKRMRHLSPGMGVGVVVNPSQYIADEGLPFLYGSDISEGRIRTDQSRRISETDSKRLPKSRLHPNDLVMVRVGAPGVTAVVPPELEGANCASLLVIRGKPSLVSTWLCYALNSRYVRSQVEVVQYGAAQEQFNVSHAVDFLIAVPPYSEQQEIAAVLDRETARIDALVATVSRAIESLRELRTALIFAAVMGKIDVKGELP